MLRENTIQKRGTAMSRETERNVQIIATAHSTLLLDDWADRQDIAAGQDPTGKATSSVVFLYRDPAGRITAKNIFSSPHIREKLHHMFPGEIILNMSNKEIGEMLSGGQRKIKNVPLVRGSDGLGDDEGMADRDLTGRN